WLNPVMTLSQSTEMASLAVLPILLLRLGLRGTLRLGLGAWVLALIVLTVGQPVELVVSSLTLNGLTITCFLVAGQVFVNRIAHGEIRASVQGLLTFTTGVGMLAGHLLTGLVRWLVNERFVPTFGVAAALGVMWLIVFLMGFPDPDRIDANAEPRVGVSAKPQAESTAPE